MSDETIQPVAHLMQSFTSEDKEKQTKRYESAQNELRILHTIPPEADRIITLFHGCETDDAVHLYLDLATKRSLVHVLDGENADATPITAANKLQFVRDMVKGLSQLAGLGVVHGDVKMENFLVTEEATTEAGIQTRIKICDFGFSFFAQEKLWSQKNGGSFSYLAPELLVVGYEPCPDHTSTIDPFALGCVLSMLCGGKATPWHDIDDQIKLAASSNRPEIIAAYVNALVQRNLKFDRLLAGLLDPKYQTRLTIEQAATLVDELTVKDFEEWVDHFPRQ